MVRRLSALLVSALMMAAAGLTVWLTMAAFAGGATAGASAGRPPLAPEVAELIQGNYLKHGVEAPDPGESGEVLKLYLEQNGAPGAMGAFRDGLKRHGESRHLRFGLARALWDEYQVTQDTRLVSEALDHVLVAVRLGVEHQDRSLYLWLVNEAGIGSGRTAEVRAFYDKLTRERPADYPAAFHHALFLARTGDAAADDQLRAAIAIRPAGNTDAVVELAERMLDRGEYAEVIALATIPGDRNYYLAFLRGVALERLGRAEDAEPLYAYASDFSRHFPFEARFRIPDSRGQEQIRFDDDVSIESHNQGHVDLSWAIACEAGGEGWGAMRAVGWTVRQRAMRGNDGCVYTGRTGATVSEYYGSVVCAKGQYAGVKCSSTTGGVYACTNGLSRTQNSDWVAYDVYYGYVPDPGLNWCPADGSSASNTCTGYCATSNITNWTRNSAHSFYGRSTCGFAYACFYQVGFTCGDGYPDNCFYRTR